MKKTFREEILEALSVPSTVTEIKNKIPRLKSFGTLSYHLKKLMEEGVITKTSEDHKQGKPTTYKINSPKIRKIYEDSNKRTNTYLIAFLKLIKQHPNIDDDEMLLKLKQQGFDDDWMGDVSMDSSHKNYSVLAHRITPKGEKFLKENSK